MPLSLYGNEIAESLSNYPVLKNPDPSIWDNFVPGTGALAMQSLAKTASAVDLLGSVGPIAKDWWRGGTELQDQYFAEHKTWEEAVKYWEPDPETTGAAARVVGPLVGMLPVVMMSPSLAVGALQISTAEDLVQKGIDATKAQAVGAVQATALGTGIWMPILGQNLWQRLVIGGAGFNAVQGVVARGVSGEILKGTAAEKDFKAWDGTALTLDVLLGAAFGTLAHLSPAQRAQGAEVWTKIKDWAQNLKPSEVDAIAALRVAEHLNSDSTPGIPAGIPDIDAHVEAMRKAINDLVQGKTVDVESIIQSARFLPDEQRALFVSKMQDELSIAAKQIVENEIALQGGTVRAMDVIRQVEALRTEVPPESTAKTVPPPRGGGENMAGTSAQYDPIRMEAERVIAENPDLKFSIGKDIQGNDIVVGAKDYLDEARAGVEQASKDASLFDVAAACWFGRQ